MRMQTYVDKAFGHSEPAKRSPRLQPAQQRHCNLQSNEVRAQLNPQLNVDLSTVNRIFSELYAAAPRDRATRGGRSRQGAGSRVTGTAPADDGDGGEIVLLTANDKRPALVGPNGAGRTRTSPILVDVG